MADKNYNLEELVLVMKNHQNIETRNQAGEKLIDEYVQIADYENLVEMSKDKDISKILRNKAGEKAIDFYVKNRQHDFLVNMSKDENIPEILRNKAGEKAKAIILNLSKKYEV